MYLREAILSSKSKDPISRSCPATFGPHNPGPANLEIHVSQSTPTSLRSQKPGSQKPEFPGFPVPVCTPPGFPETLLFMEKTSFKPKKSSIMDYVATLSDISLKDKLILHECNLNKGLC